MISQQYQLSSIGRYINVPTLASAEPTLSFDNRVKTDYHALKFSLFKNNVLVY